MVVQPCKHLGVVGMERLVDLNFNWHLVKLTDVGLGKPNKHVCADLTSHVCTLVWI